MVVLAALVMARFEKPAILISWQDGMRIRWTAEERQEETSAVIVAVWRDGRIVWRSPESLGVVRKGKWVIPPGRYYSAQIDPKRVTQTLRRLKGARVAAFNHKGSVIPDAESTAISLCDGGWTVRMSSSEDPPRPDGDRIGPSFVSAWNRIKREARSLIPAKGNRLPQIDFSGWD